MPQLDDGAGLLTGFLAAKRYEAARPYLSGRVLDFGCASGRLAEWCRPDAYVGVDIDVASLEIARRRHPSFRFAAELPTGELFDTIVALAVIEHVKDPAALLSTLGALLRPAGRVVITTPDPRLGWAHAAGARVRLFSREANEEHEELLGRARMTEVADEAGLSVAHFRRFLLGANQLFLLVAR
jgi:2-polyprenyl-3-methyl-5-hydroxy-6-metoxy-1,4-benzoquinol methylase